MFDFGTGWTSCHPVNSRSEEDTLFAFHELSLEGSKYYLDFNKGTGLLSVKPFYF
jgi:hypothetical protein